ncbi:hypothetical protein N7G274_007202 [Stereocaulon virgatum]|uniref:Uncharacterized protein n=1 Tax=Stereocaulon virgatum TaxID=373712 RepID=A0ABR4A461_9LECA
MFAKGQEDKGKLARDEERLLFYGSDFIRNRRQMHGKMGPLDEDALASSELGVIWAANSNIISAVFW